MPEKQQKTKSIRAKLNQIIFGTDTCLGRLFDIILLWAIVFSIFVVMIDSVSYMEKKIGRWLFGLEWFFTILFTLEYSLRLYISKRPVRYIFSFFGIVDLFALIPTYLSLFLSGTQYLLVIRVLRLLRVFRILKLARYSSEAKTLLDGLKASRPKIIIFFGSITTLVVILGAFMYLIEGAENGFTSIPRSIYWAIVTMTTVGYGDIAPKTIIGQTLAAIIMVLGYSIIAVPTGIITASLTQIQSKKQRVIKCSVCRKKEHDNDAVFCKYCGNKLKRNRSLG